MLFPHHLWQVDQAFDILNSKSKFGRDYKAALQRENFADRCQALKDFISYLHSLQTPSGDPLFQSRRKTFIVGFTATANCVMQLADSLLSSPSAGYEFLLTFRLSQDHIETLFSKVRRMHGCNNNPNVSQFRSAIKRLLCKQSIQSSKAANTLDCESTSGVFKLEWRRSPLSSEGSDEDNDDLTPLHLDEFGNGEHPIDDNILCYIAGYIVHSLQGSISCDTCADALVQQKNRSVVSSEHQYASKTYEKHEMLTMIKDRGGLLLPSAAVFRTVQQCEKVFRLTVLCAPSKYIAHKSLKSHLLALLRKYVIEDHPVSLFTHCCNDTELGMLSHQQQLVNMISAKFFDLRLKFYSKKYNSSVVNKFGSDRSRLSRLIIFKHQ